MIKGNYTVIACLYLVSVSLSGTPMDVQKKRLPWGWPWEYDSVAHFISEKFIRPQFQRIKKTELPDIFRMVKLESEKRVPDLVDIGLKHLAEKIKPYAIGGTLAVGGAAAGWLLYNRLYNIGLTRLINQFKGYDRVANDEARVLSEQLAVFKSSGTSAIDKKNITVLHELLTEYKAKIEKILTSLEPHMTDKK